MKYKKTYEWLDFFCAKLKSKELAELAHVSPATLAKMKKDGVSVNSDVLVRICVALDCTLNDIMEIVED